MKTQTQFKNASLVSVINGSIVVKDSTGGEHTFVNASVVSVNNGTIIIDSEWKPKRGELVKILNGCADSYSIFDDLDKKNGRINIFGYKRLNRDRYYLDAYWWAHASTIEISPVTPEEQKEFDDFCKSKGKIWNKETLQWEKYRWVPRDWERYYIIYGNGEIDCLHYVKSEFQDRYIDLGNCFKTKEEAEAKLEQIKKLLLEV